MEYHGKKGFPRDPKGSAAEVKDMNSRSLGRDSTNVAMSWLEWGKDKHHITTAILENHNIYIYIYIYIILYIYIYIHNLNQLYCFLWLELRYRLRRFIPMMLGIQNISFTQAVCSDARKVSVLHCLCWQGSPSVRGGQHFRRNLGYDKSGYDILCLESHWRGD